MKFYVDINVKDLPATRYRNTSAGDFEKLPAEQGDLLLATSSDYERCICFRDGRYYKGQDNQKGPGDICTIEFDDFVPGMMLDDNPEWYDLLKDRIVATRAQGVYGPGQGINVTEHIANGSAVARVRNQQAIWGRNGELVYVVKITATGPESLKDARKLHSMILEGCR